jgi:hypothetical protein
MPPSGPSRGARNLKMGAMALKMAMNPLIRLWKKLTIPAYQGFFSGSGAGSDTLSSGGAWTVVVGALC